MTKGRKRRSPFANYVHWRGSLHHAMFSLVTGVVKMMCGIEKFVEDVEFQNETPDRARFCSKCRRSIGAK